MRLQSSHWWLLAAALLGTVASCSAARDDGLDGASDEALHAALNLQVTAQAAPAQAKAGDDVTVSLSITARRSTWLDVTLNVLGPSGAVAYTATWPATAIQAGVPLVLEEPVAVEAADAAGGYKVWVDIARTGSTRPVFTDKNLTSFTVAGGGTCVAKTDAELCAAAGKSCGAFVAQDSCTHQDRAIASCGPCAGTCTNNVCAAPPTGAVTLRWASPAASATVKGTTDFKLTGTSLVNVEIFNAGKMLVRCAVSADRTTATASIDTTKLANGSVAFTAHAWNSPPGDGSFTSEADAGSLTVNVANGGTPDPCAGQICSGHGRCQVGGGAASCVCDPGFHASGLSCVQDSQSGDQPDPGMAFVPSGYRLTFSDEFNATTLDKNKWNTLAPFGVQWYSDSNQKQAFVDSAVSLKNGLLVFTAQRSNGSGTNGQPYSSGSITSNGTFTYGYYETRARVPAGKGFWPAFWLTSSTRWPPEWDIFEIIDGDIFGYTHELSGGKCTFVDGAAGSDSTYRIPNVYGVFHIYGFKWTQTDLYWYVDGVMTEHYAANAAAGTTDPFWWNISLQVGGSWPGDPDGSTPFPSTMEVDYMRLYQQ
jgi:beta-glucanase (GH16 family)